MDLISKNGIKIEYGPWAEGHMKAHADMIDLLPKAVAALDLDATPAKRDTFTDKENGRKGTAYGFVITFDHVVGKTIRVNVEVDEQPMLFCLRPNRTNYTRVVRPRPAADTCSIVMWIRHYDDDGSWEFRTAYAGDIAPSEPTFEGFTRPRTPEIEAQFQTALAFWSKNALIWQEGDGQIIESSYEEILRNGGML